MTEEVKKELVLRCMILRRQYFSGRSYKLPKFYYAPDHRDSPPKQPYNIGSYQRPNYEDVRWEMISPPQLKKELSFSERLKLALYHVGM